MLGCERTREAVLIDPGDEVDDLLAFIERERLKALAILLTHAHVDHVVRRRTAKRGLEVPVYLHRDDLFLYDAGRRRTAGCSACRSSSRRPSMSFTRGAAPIAFGDYDVFVHHTPGHCPGGVCLQVGRRGERGQDLFVGDTLFAGSIGRTDLPGGDLRHAAPLDHHVLYSFGDQARVYPGHGPETTIGDERRTNPFLLEWERRSR